MIIDAAACWFLARIVSKPDALGSYAIYKPPRFTGKVSADMPAAYEWWEHG
jgi:hypothetical protein